MCAPEPKTCSRCGGTISKYWFRVNDFDTKFRISAESDPWPHLPLVCWTCVKR